MITCDCGRGKYNDKLTDKCAYCEYDLQYETYTCNMCGEECASAPDSFCEDCTAQEQMHGMHYGEYDTDDMYYGGDGIYAPTISESDQL